MARFSSRLGFQRLKESFFLPFQQFAGAGVDSDEADYRSLTQGSAKDLAPLTHTRVLQLAYYLYRSNPLARRIVEVTKDFVVGDGFTISSPVPEVDTVLKAHWVDPVNNWPQRLHQCVLELSLYGELFLPVFVNEVSGHVRLGVIDPLEVTQVVTDPENRQLPIGLVVSRGAKKAKYQIILVETPDGSVVSDRGRIMREQQFIDGQAFYCAVNKVSTATRGGSDLECLIDLLDHFDRLHFDVADRVAFLNAFVWDVTLEGADSNKVNEWLKNHSAPPKPGTVRAHNEREKWSPVSPDLKSNEVHELVRMVKSYILAGAGIPEHWISEGMDITRATAAESHGPVIKRLQVRQDYVIHAVEAILTYQVQRAIEPVSGRLGPLAALSDGKGGLEVDGESLPISDAISILPSTMTPDNLAAASTTFEVTARGVAMALTDKTIDADAAVKIMAKVVKEYGIEMNVAKVLEERGTDTAHAADRKAVKEIYATTR